MSDGYKEADLILDDSFSDFLDEVCLGISLFLLETYTKLVFYIHILVMLR